MEELKLQISELTVENQKHKDRIRVQGDSNQRTVASLESRVQSLTAELQTVNEELSSVKEEYDSYKVRASSVLRQQKSKTPADSLPEMDKQER